jgi:transcriptional regulator
MHVPAHYAVRDEARMRAFIEAQGFGILMTSGEGGLSADHLPFILDGDRMLSHMNAKNPTAARMPGPGLAVFTGPHAYISPRWYSSGLIVPTWNYMAVHVRGRLEKLGDRENFDVLRRLVGTYEDLVEGPFAANYASDELRDFASGTQGFAFWIEEMVGQFKLSQNRSDADRAAAIANLLASGRGEDALVANAMELEWAR